VLAAGDTRRGGAARERHRKVLPDGRDYHICFGTDGDLHLSEIWDSLEHLQAYGEVLMPILAEAGIQFSGEPEVFQVHNIVKR
jgi:hypothetical protein